MREFLLLFLAIFSLQCMGDSLENYLTENQYELIKKANSGLSPDGFSVEALVSNNDQLVILLGEMHKKSNRHSLLGKKILNNFSIRLLESVPKKEFEDMPNIVRGVIKFSHWLGGILFSSDSTMSVGLDSKVLLGKNSKAVEVTTADLKKCENFSDSYFDILKNDTNPHRGALVRKAFVETIDTCEFEKFNFWLEDSFKIPTENIKGVESLVSYIFDKRNIRFAYNISDVINDLSSHYNVFLVIQGKAHNTGVASLLIKQLGYSRIRIE